MHHCEEYHKLQSFCCCANLTKKEHCQGSQAETLRRVNNISSQTQVREDPNTVLNHSECLTSRLENALRLLSFNVAEGIPER